MSELKLIYVNAIGQRATGEYEYEFFFSKKPFNLDFNENWKNEFAGISDDMMPSENDYCEIKHLVTARKLSCAQENMCYPFMYSVYGVIALCFESLEGLEEYPEPFRLVLQYGDTLGNIQDTLSQLELSFEEDVSEEPAV